MSKEDFHNDLLSRLDPETVQKALERYNRKNSNVGLHNDNESVASGVPSKSLESLPSTPRYFKCFYVFRSIDNDSFIIVTQFTQLCESLLFIKAPQKFHRHPRGSISLCKTPKQFTKPTSREKNERIITQSEIWIKYKLFSSCISSHITLPWKKR